MSAIVENDRITMFRSTVDIAFGVERKRLATSLGAAWQGRQALPSSRLTAAGTLLRRSWNDSAACRFGPVLKTGQLFALGVDEAGRWAIGSGRIEANRWTGRCLGFLFR
jgi:hypothetical protein